MKNYIRSIRIFLILALLLFPIATNGATVPSIASADRDYNANKYRDAAEKYQKIVDSMTVKSETQKQELLRCQYNLARSLDKSGQFSKAKDFYLTVAGSSDENLALQAKYDLACLYIQMANQSAGKNPAELDKDARLSIEEDVNNAIEQFRVILELKPEYPEVHDKMERALATLNVWKKAWADADFKKEMEPKKALEFTAEVENDILNANSKANRLGLQTDSHNMRQNFYQEAEQISDLTRKLPIVEEKMLRFLSGQEPQEVPGQNGQPGTVVQRPAPQLTPEQQAQLAQVKPVIESWVKDSKENLEQSAIALHNRDVTKADEVQKKALKSLDKLYLAISPLDETIKRAIEQQKTLIKSTESRIKEQKPSDESAQSDKNKDDKTEKKDDNLQKLEVSEEAFKEEMMLPWTATIVPKAKGILSQLPPEKVVKKKSKDLDKSEDDSKLTLKNAVKDTVNSLQDAFDMFQNPKDKTVDTQSANPQDQQIQKVRKMCKKAVELGPKIPELIQKATQDMKAEKWETALESQKEALRLLEEIIKDDSQPNQQNQDNQNQDNKDQQQNKDQQNQDKNKQDKNNQNNQDKQQNKQDQKSEQDKQKEEQDKQKDKQEQKEQEDQQKQEEKDAQEQEAERKKAQAKEEEMTDSEARGLMRRVQTRHEEQKKLEKEVQRRLNPPEKVEKDW